MHGALLLFLLLYCSLSFRQWDKIPATDSLIQIDQNNKKDTNQADLLLAVADKVLLL